MSLGNFLDGFTSDQQTPTRRSGRDLENEDRVTELTRVTTRLVKVHSPKEEYQIWSRYQLAGVPSSMPGGLAESDAAFGGMDMRRNLSVDLLDVALTEHTSREVSASVCMSPRHRSPHQGLLPTLM